MKIPADIAQQIANREITGREAAAKLRITEQYLCLLLKKQNIKRIEGPSIVNRDQMSALSTARKEFRKELAAQVYSGNKSITAAAREAKCSERTIYRYLNIHIARLAKRGNP